jgi:hypothetical protein
MPGEPWLAEPSMPSGQSESGIDPAIDAAIAALRQTSASDPLAMFNMPSDSAAFDALAAQTPAILSNQKLGGASVQSAAERAGQSPTQVVALASAEEAFGYAPDAELLGAARRLALLRQDIAGFGGHLTIDRLDWSRGGDPFVMNNW